ncbi:MAG: hypothetical protein HY340_01465 [Candidatus Kerfeldbacteria bacterium]|nr:hypothetical protein [Candidatus Kerfeldbacteria bacterium]
MPKQQKKAMIVEEKVGQSVGFRLGLAFAFVALIALAAFLSFLFRKRPPAEQIGYPIDSSWIVSDWSGGNYEQASNVDPESVGGEVALQEQHPNGTNSLRFVELYDPDNGYPFFDAEAVADLVGFVAAEQPWGSLNETFDVYDFATGETRFVATFPDDFGVQRMKAIDGKLVIPGSDGLNDPQHFNGDYYEYTPATGAIASHISVVDYAGHTHDAERFQNYLFITASQHENQGGPAPLSACVEHSPDGTAFDAAYCLPRGTGNCSIRNIFNMTTFGNRLFVNTDNAGATGECPAGSYGILSTTGGSGAPNTWAWEVATLQDYPRGSTEGFLSGDFAEYRGKLYFNVGDMIYGYNEQNNTWTKLPLVPNPVPYGNAQGGFEVHKDRLYVAGVTGLGPIVYSTDNPEAGTWTVAAENFGQATAWEAPGGFASAHGRLFASTRGGPLVGGGAVYVSAVEQNGFLITRPHQFNNIVDGRSLSWTALAPDVHPGTELGLQVRSAATIPELAAAQFIGPDGTANSFYATSGMGLSAHHNNRRAFQVKIVWNSDSLGKQTAILQDVTLGTSRQIPPSNQNTNIPGNLNTNIPGNLNVNIPPGNLNVNVPPGNQNTNTGSGTNKNTNLNFEPGY